jgi:trehalose synthase-fused probable maltokinase
VTDERALIEFVTGQRWFGSKTREVVRATLVDRATLREDDPRLELQLVETRFAEGTHETYQLLVSSDSLDALEDPRHVRELVHVVRAARTIPAEQGVVGFNVVEGHAGLGHELRDVRRVDAEQSNTSVVFDDELILKVFRRLEAGINPELELLRFLTQKGFENIAQLAGWYAYQGRPMDATLGVLQRYIVGGEDGWDLALDMIARDPETLVSRLRRLGEVTGRMHAVLGSDATDPTFCPEETSGESLGLLTATVDEEIEAIFLELPPGVPELEPIRGRGEEVRERLRHLTSVGGAGRVIRHHGDFHLGQTLWSGDDWVILDFEGEPARSLPERRRKRSPLRDVAGMLRSFAYAVSAERIQRGIEPPPDWERQARAEFLDGYRSTVDQSLVPTGTAMDKLLSVFELEKAVYELRYELNNRPNWVEIPVAGILRLLESEVAP